MRRAARAGTLLAIASLLIPGPPRAEAAVGANDPAFVQDQQWALTGAPGSINSPPSWGVSSGAGVLIADVDTGADFSHPDLGGKLVPGAHFFPAVLGGTQTDSNVSDDNGHGTMTAGIMAADTNNGIGIASVAPGARVLVVKSLDQNGSGTSDSVGAGIRYAVNYRGPSGERVRVINLSVGSDVPALLSVLGGTQVQDAIRFAAQNDIAVAAAAGNSGSGLLSSNDYGSVSDVALVAGAVGREARRAPYSTNGNIYAPGGDSSGGADVQHEVLSTVPGGYGFAEGTSFSAPHVAGVLAQLIARGYSAAGARQRILATAAARAGVPELDASSAVGSAPLGSASSGTGSAPIRAAGRPSTRAGARGSSGTGAAAGAGAPAGATGATPAPSPVPLTGALLDAAAGAAPQMGTPGPATTTAAPAIARADGAAGEGGGAPVLALTLIGLALGGAGIAAWLLRRRLVSQRRRRALGSGS